MTPEGVPNFSWVVPDALAASGRPARGLSWEAAGVYAGLHVCGVRVVASLLETPTPPEYLTPAGLVGLHFPIGDFGAPRDVNAFGAFVDEVHAQIAAGRPALVHCWAGIGRAGMFSATYLARHRGFAPDAAIAEERRLRPGSIETSDQIRIVGRLARKRP